MTPTVGPQSYDGGDDMGLELGVLQSQVYDAVSQVVTQETTLTNNCGCSSERSLLTVLVVLLSTKGLEYPRLG